MGRSVEPGAVANKRRRTSDTAQNINDDNVAVSVNRDSISDQEVTPVNRAPKASPDSDARGDSGDRLFDLVRNVANGVLPSSSAAEGLRKKFPDAAPNSPVSFRILDCIGYLLEYSNFRHNLEAFLASLESVGLLTARSIVAAIDAYKLDGCGYSAGLTTIAIRERTRNQFVLKSYALWRECTVGFDLLQQLLYHQEWDAGDLLEMGQLRDSVKYIAGQYSLCPTRVLYELIAWSSWHDGDGLMLLLQQYPKGRVDEVVRLMLTQKCMLKQEYQTVKKQYWRIPSTLGLYFPKLCARLLVEGILDLSTLYPYLEPADADLSNLGFHFLSVSKRMPSKLDRNDTPVTYLIPLANCSYGDNAPRQMLDMASAEKLYTSVTLDSTTITSARELIHARHAKVMEHLRASSTAATSPNSFGMAAWNPSDRFRRNESVSSVTSSSGVSNLLHKAEHRHSATGNIDVVKYNLLDSDGYAYVKDHIFALECDKLSVLSHLFDIARDLESPAWILGKLMLDHIQVTAKFPVVLHGSICKAMCNLILRLIKKHTKTNDWRRGIDQIDRVLRILGPGLHINLVCFSATIKFLQNCLEKHIDRVCRIVWRYLLPALCMVVEGNCQVADRLWNLLSNIPASKRYRIYNLYLSRVLDSRSTTVDAWACMVRASYNCALVKTRSIFKRVTATMLKTTKSASVRGNVSTVCGLSAVDPFAVAHTIVSQCEMFENLVLPLSEVGKYFGHLACDVFFFKLTANQNQVCFRCTAEVDDVGRSKRLLVNAQLASRFFRRHMDVDLAPLLVGALTIIQRSMMINQFDIIPRCSEEGGDIPMEFSKRSIKLRPIDTGSRLAYPHELSNGWLALEYVSKLLELVGGVPQLAEAHALTIDQLNAQGGGVFLRSEIMTQDPDDETCGMSSRENLAKIMLRPFFSHSLLFLCGKMRQEVMYDSEFRAGVVYLCATVDHLQKMALQFVEFREAVDIIVNRGLGSESFTLQFSFPSFDELRRFWDEANALYFSHSCTNPPASHSSALSHTAFKPQFLEFVNNIHLRDIWVPVEQYQKTLQRLEGWIKDIGSAHSSGSHRRLKKLRSRYQALEREVKQQEEHVANTKLRFEEAISSGWLTAEAQIGPGVTIAFLKHCIVPRVFVNEAEAAFCGRLVDLMLHYRLECFNFFDFSNCWTKMLMSMVRCCTEREAPLLAIFVNHMFGVIREWSSNAELFEGMTQGHPCFCTTFKYVPDKALTHQQLLGGIRKWEGRIIRALSYALTLHIPESDGGLSKSDSLVSAPTWIDQKGAVVFLARCHESFPITCTAGKRVLTGLRCVVESAQRQGWKDVVAAASTLLKTFEKYERTNKWL